MRLSKIYKTEEALENALKNLNIESSAKATSPKLSKSTKPASSSMEFDMDLVNDSPIPIHLQCGAFIYHGDETDNINDIINNQQFQPNLVSDFIDINAADWNRLFHWKF